MVDKDLKDSSKGKERKCIAAGLNEHKPELKEYTLPFSPENFDILFKQRPGQSPGSVSMAISDEGSGERPRQIDNHEKFKNTPFEDLWHNSKV
jgi:hypothetical protein